MRAWHGSGERFERFDPQFIGSGEGLAKRGHGFNFCLDRSVAEHFARCAASRIAYLYEVEIPGLETLLNLDESVGSHVPLVLALHQALGVDHTEIFDEAAADEDISMSYADERAQAMLERVFLDASDAQAWEELAEWSPGFNWRETCERVREHAIEFDPNVTDVTQLCEVAAERLGGADAAARWLMAQGYEGTCGREAMSEGSAESAVSVVIFEAERIRIRAVEPLRVEPHAEADASPPGP